MKFFIEIERPEHGSLHLETEATNAHEAVRLASAFIAGANVERGAATLWQIARVAKTKAKGVTYGRLA